MTMQEGAIKASVSLHLAAGYSIWTNYDYKAPLACSALACILGNLFYCLSFDFKSLPLLLLARLVTGVGVPCVRLWDEL